MDPAFRIVVVAYGIAGAIGLLIYLVITYRARKRTSALTEVAQSLGFLFLGNESTDSAPEAYQALFENTDFFEKGRAAKCKNIMRGTMEGLQTSIFDYLYLTGGGRGAQTWQQTVFAFSHDVPLPAFKLKPENLMDRVRDIFAHDDIDFDSHPEFSRRYLLRAPRGERIKELFTPELLTYLEGLPPEPKWYIEGNRQILFIYLFDGRIAPEDISSFARNTSSIASNFIKILRRGNQHPAMRGSE